MALQAAPLALLAARLRSPAMVSARCGDKALGVGTCAQAPVHPQELPRLQRTSPTPRSHTQSL